MISREDLRRLQLYPSGPDSFILSLYVNVDQSNAANLNRGFETKVDSLFRQVGEDQNSNGGSKQRFDAECKRVRQFLSDYVPKGKALVLFSDSRQEFWWHRDLQVDLPTGARWSPQPWVRPLLEVVEEHDRLCLVLIDKQHARILAVEAREQIVRRARHRDTATRARERGHSRGAVGSTQAHLQHLEKDAAQGR